MRQARNRLPLRPPLSRRPVDYRKRDNLWKKLGPIVIVGAIAIAFIVGLAWISWPAHPAVGGWRYGFLILRIESNNVATINSIICSWRKIDRNTIWIQPSSKIPIPDVGTIEVAFDFTVQQGGKKAVMRVFGYPLTLDKDNSSVP